MSNIIKAIFIEPQVVAAIISSIGLLFIGVSGYVISNAFIQRGKKNKYVRSVLLEYLSVLQTLLDELYVKTSFTNNILDNFLEKVDTNFCVKFESISNFAVIKKNKVILDFLKLFKYCHEVESCSTDKTKTVDDTIIQEIILKKTVFLQIKRESRWKAVYEKLLNKYCNAITELNLTEIISIYCKNFWCYLKIKKIIKKLKICFKILSNKQHHIYLSALLEKQKAKILRSLRK
ncbi:MAG: hypothetical protein FWH03_08060 [Firmicutes bacterium]|nr:hypothetical protein [Bacillota bacterium]